jgi:translation initiation factor IF-1
MPNTRGGKGYKKGKTGRVKTRPEKAIESVDVTEGEGFYARIKKRLGGKPAKFEVTLSNGTTSEVIVRGKMHKKVWINPGMLVLINNGQEIVKVIRETDKDAREANDMMGKVENNNSVFSTFFANESSDDEEDDINLSNESSDKSDNNSSNSLGNLNNPNKNRIKNIKRQNKNESSDDEESDDDSGEDEDNEESGQSGESGESEESEESDGKTQNKYPQKKDKRDKKEKRSYDRSKKSGDINIDDI